MCLYRRRGTGLKKEIEKRINDHIRTTDDRDDIFLFNKRQMLLVSKLDTELKTLILAVKRGENIDVISFLIRNNIRLIDELIGKDHVPEEILDELFSRFCIGK